MNIVVRIEALNYVGFLFLDILSWQFQMYVVFYPMYWWNNDGFWTHIYISPNRCVAFAFVWYLTPKRYFYYAINVERLENSLSKMPFH